MKKTIALIIILILLLVPCIAFAEEALPSASVSVPEEQEAISAPEEQAQYPDQAGATNPDAPGEAPAENADLPVATDQAGLPAGTPEFDGSIIPESMSAILVEASTGQILYQKNAQEQIYPASTTKLLTALITLDQATDLDEKITVGAEVNEFSSKSSLMHLKSGHSVSIKELIYGLMLPSGNDAAAAIAVHYGGSISGFADMMNAKAQELGMANSTFSNPHGLSLETSKNYSTAEDMAKLAQAAHENETLADIVATTSYEVTTTELNASTQTMTNSNVLLRTPESESGQARYKDYLYPPATGMKTGLLQNVDGNSYYGCIVSSAEKDGLDLIACAFGDTSSRSLERWNTVISLFDYGFNNLTWANLGKYITPIKETRQITEYAANDPQEGQISVVSSENIELPGTELIYKPLAEELENGTTTVNQNIEISSNLAAPIEEGAELGKVSYSIGDTEIYSVPLISNRTVFAKGQEQQTKLEYALPGAVEGMPPYWWLIIVIPAAGIGIFLLLRVLLSGGSARPNFSILDDKKSRRSTRSNSRGYGYGYASKDSEPILNSRRSRQQSIARTASSGRLSQTANTHTENRASRIPREEQVPNAQTSHTTRMRPVQSFDYDQNEKEDKSKHTAVLPKGTTYYYDESAFNERPRRDKPGRTRHRL